MPAHGAEIPAGPSCWRGMSKPIAFILAVLASCNPDPLEVVKPAAPAVEPKTEPTPSPPRRTVLCMPREGAPVAWDTSQLSILSPSKCGTEAAPLPCDRGIACDREGCTCICDEDFGDCEAAALYLRQEHGVELLTTCEDSLCGWARP